MRVDIVLQCSSNWIALYTLYVCVYKVYICIKCKLFYWISDYFNQIFIGIHFIFFLLVVHTEGIFLIWCLFFLSLGSTFICNTHIIPVKNQEGVAMMFIINFEYVTDEENAATPERVNPILPVKTVNRK